MIHRKHLSKILYAASAALVLAACTDRPTEPTAPPPEPSISLSCRPTPHFPIVQVSGLILKVFPKGKLQVEALARAGAVALFWESCKKPAAQKAAVEFVNFMNANSSKMIGTPTQRNTLISLILNGVGIPFITPPSGTKDFGIGIYNPANPNKTLITTLNGTALVELEFGSFSEQTVIVITRRPDGSDPLSFEGNQFPPFWDYDAINASGNHVLGEGHSAIIAFCLLDTDVQSYPESRRIGHNPVQGAPGFPFEILEAVDRPDLTGALNCGNLAPNTSLLIGGFGQGLPGLANAAWATTRDYLAPAARALFLPEALHAATLALIELPPPASRLPSMGPVGIVQGAEPQNRLQFNPPNGDPGGKIFDWNSELTWLVCSEDCSGPLFPAVLVTGDDGSAIAGVDVTVTFFPVGESGEFGFGSTLTETTNSLGVATFDWLMIATQGTFQLEFSAPGTISNITSGVFKVYPYNVGFAPGGNPFGLDFDQTLPLSWECNFVSTCWPTIRVDGNGEPVGGVEVTVELVPVVSSSTGSFLQGSTTSVVTGVLGEARFDNLRISASEGGGTYILVFTAFGLGAVSGQFEVFNP